MLDTNTLDCSDSKLNIIDVLSYRKQNSNCITGYSDKGQVYVIMWLEIVKAAEPHTANNRYGEK